MQEEAEVVTAPLGTELCYAPILAYFGLNLIMG